MRRAISRNPWTPIKTMTKKNRIEWKNIRILPILHNRMEFALEVRRQVEEFRPDRVAVEYPATLGDLILKGIRRLPLLSAVYYQETDEDAQITADGLERAYKEGLVDYRQSTVCTVMEGTELETIQKREGWYKQPEYSGRDLRKAYGTPWLSASRIDYWQSRFNQVCPVGIPQ